MDGMAISAIIVASITTMGTVIVGVLNSLRKENREDHNTVRARLDELKQDVKDIDHKLDDHITWHLDEK